MSESGGIIQSITNFFGSFLRFFEEKGRLRAESLDCKQSLAEKQKELDELRAKNELLEKNADEFKEKVKLIEFLGGFEEMQKLIDEHGSFLKIKNKLLEGENLKLKVSELIESQSSLIKENSKLKSEIKELKGLENK